MSEGFIDNMEFEEFEEFEEVLCAFINEQNTTNIAKKFVKGYAKLLDTIVDRPFRLSYLKKRFNSASFEESKEFEEVLCAFINEQNTTYIAKKFMKGYAKLLDTIVDRPFKLSYLKKRFDSVSVGNVMEFYYDLIEVV
ncbi:hypothetical protein LWI29_014701 [Acer saccharum]|uniref:Uncharacterized protein n=1 Tax=Acer saccharum TaxID=4024 RepID=A0AA39T2F7_ACESA|nr:hypothetical protein LWI29_014701 [Acer saccharum]